ncbi:MAG: ABC transporter permease [Cyclobacteriaceae bacterium]
MRTIRFLIRKEFVQLFRNKAILPLLLVAPIIQLLILSYAADFEIKNIKLHWVDQDQSSVSRLLRQKLEASPYFRLSGTSFDVDAGEQELNMGNTDMIVVVPRDFERNLSTNSNPEIQLLVNAIDGTKAGLGNFYMGQVINDLSREFREANPGYNMSSIRLIQPTYRFWFNPNLNYKTFMVPGILVLLVTMIGGFVAAMNIVREKELGTIEQLNVTPIRKHHFILGKLIPLWILGVFEFTLGLIVAKLMFNIPIVGSPLVLYLFLVFYLIMITGMGMLISTVTDTQQQAMFISWFFMVIFILMSGLFTPVENMPSWAQKITLLNPIKYFIDVVRLVLLKGATLKDIQFQLYAIAAYGMVINALAVFRYRKTV